MDEMDKRQSILIIGDNQKDLTILRSLLRNSYTIRATSKLEMVLKIIDSKKTPDLVFFDNSIPGIDGHELCRQLKGDSRTWNIPVIFITPNRDEETEIKVFQMGAADYVSKPFNPVVINARVQTYIEMKKYRDHLENSSYCDGLTTIPNRRRLDEYYDSVWNFAVRESLPLSLIKIKIDGFTQYNEKYGHQAGDSCIIRSAEKLSAMVNRKTDLVVRYGREEFICVLPNTRIDGAITIAEQFRTGILSLRITDSYSPFGYETISQGVATVIPTKELLPQILISATDEALEKSKEGSRNQINCKSL